MMLQKYYLENLVIGYHFDINKKFLAIFNYQQIRKDKTIKENRIRNLNIITIIPDDFEFL